MVGHDIFIYFHQVGRTTNRITSMLVAKCLYYHYYYAGDQKVLSLFSNLVLYVSFVFLFRCLNGFLKDVREAFPILGERDSLFHKPLKRLTLQEFLKERQRPAATRMLKQLSVEKYSTVALDERRSIATW